MKRSLSSPTLLYSFLILSLFFCKITPPAEPNHLEMAILSDPSTLDPLWITDLVGGKIQKYLHRTLFRSHSDGKPLPDLAKNPQFFPGTPKNTLVLEWETVRSAEGVELNGKILLWNLKRMVQLPSPKRPLYADWDIQVKDAKIQITTRDSFSVLKEKLSLPQSSILAIQQENENWELPSRWEGFGPYTLREWVKNDHLDFIKNPHHPRQGELPQTIRLRVLPQSRTAFFLYSRNELDSMKLPDFLLSSPSIPDSSKQKIKGRSVQYLAFNHTNPCIDLPFRNAIQKSIRRNLVQEKILDGEAESVVASVPYSRILSHPLLSQQPNLKPKSFTEDELEEAKTSLGASRCYLEWMQKGVELRMRGDEENQSKGQAIASEIERLGIRVKLVGLEKVNLYKENSEKKGELTLLTWYTDTPQLSNFFDPVFRSDRGGSGGNRAFYQNKRVDELLQKITEGDETSYLELVDILQKEQTWVFLWSLPEVYAVSETFKKYPFLQEFL